MKVLLQFCNKLETALLKVSKINNLRSGCIRINIRYDEQSEVKLWLKSIICSVIPGYWGCTPYHLIFIICPLDKQSRLRSRQGQRVPDRPFARPGRRPVDPGGQFRLDVLPHRFQVPRSQWNRPSIQRRAYVSPYSFSMTAIRLPCSSLNIRLSEVVFPEPRKPVRMVTGTFSFVFIFISFKYDLN